MPEGIKCPHCGLVQYRNPDNLCKRCKNNVDDTPAPVNPENQPEAVSSQDSPATDSSTADPSSSTPSPDPAESTEPPRPDIGGFNLLHGCLIVFVLVLIFCLIKSPAWFKMKGGKVKHFLDSTELIEIQFPDNWYYMGLKSDIRKDKIQIPGFGKADMLDTLRGSFYMGKKKDPHAIMIIRLESLGITGAMGFSMMGTVLERATPEQIGNTIHTQLSWQASAMGGEYTPMSLTRVPLDRVKALQTDGTLGTKMPFYQWKDGGKFRVVLLYFKESARVYWFYIYIPESKYNQVWPVVRQVLNDTTLHQAAF